MVTALWAIFYLWLVLGILLAAMWFLHRQDRHRNGQPEDDVLLPAMDEPLSEAAKAACIADRTETTKSKPKKSRSEQVRKPKPDQKPENAPAAEPAIADSEPAPAKAESSTESQPEAEPAKSGSKEAERVKANGTGKGASNGDGNGNGNGNGNGKAATVPKDEPSIEQLLEGITLPFGLAASEECIVDSGRHAVFLSAHPDAAEVGTAFADELVDLGYEIEPSGLDQALAIRNGQVLSMRITANAGAGDDDANRYPNASEGDVAIEIWTGDGPAPSTED